MAYVLSSVSGNLISAASAGYAPTNSGDVSAIASAYQVVSATATQLYAGTAYVTSINDAPVSAARAGNAANASLANSAYYDGTGRLISALPDSATVSAIASSYVESGVSSKQDTLSFAYNTADQISSINGSALGGMDEAAVSGIASAYAESAVSSKADSSALSSYALSSDVSGTVDIVSTQSANWGGSALALSAGPGVKLEKSGNVLVASTDTTLLWSGDLTTGGTRLASLSEPLTNFERLGFLHSFEGTAIGSPQWAVLSAGFAQTTGTSRVIGTIGPAMSLKPWENNDIYQAFGNYVTPSSATNNDQIYLRGAKVLLNGGAQDFGHLYHCYAIYGINRTAEE